MVAIIVASSALYNKPKMEPIKHSIQEIYIQNKSPNSEPPATLYQTKILLKSSSSKDRIFAIFQDRIVGRGANSVVKQAIRLDDPSQLLAVKIIDISSRSSYDRGCQELLVAKQVGASENIVKIYPFKVTSKQHMYIFMQYCQDGTLFQRLHNKNKPMQKRQIFGIFRQLINGYGIFQRCGILHEDIKPQNILVSGDVFKIADFGLTSFITQPPTISSKRKGTFKYMAPEKILQVNYIPNIKSDIYSLGVLMYEVMTGQHPYFPQEFGTIQQLTNLKSEPVLTKLKQNDDASLELLFSLILKMVKRQESQRATWSDICEFSTNLSNSVQHKVLSPLFEPQRHFHQNWQQCYSDIQIVEGPDLHSEKSRKYRKETQKVSDDSSRTSQQIVDVLNKIIYFSRDLSKHHHHRILLGFRYASISLKMYFRRENSQENKEEAYEHLLDEERELETHKEKDHRFRRILEMLSGGTLQKDEAVEHFCNYARVLIAEEVSQLNHLVHTKKQQTEAVIILYFTVCLVMQLQGHRHLIEMYDVRKDISRMTEFIMSFGSQATAEN